MDIVKGKIGNALTSAASNHVVATANDIYDENLGDYQNNINLILSDIGQDSYTINENDTAIVITRSTDMGYLKDISIPIATEAQSGFASKRLVSLVNAIKTSLEAMDVYITHNYTNVHIALGDANVENSIVPYLEFVINGATKTRAGVMTPTQVAFIEYNQGHNTCDEFADIPTNKHICLVDLTGIAAAEGETSTALTVAMEGTGEHDGAEVLLYCHHDGDANLNIGVPASSTNGAEYVLIPNAGEQYIYVGTQELDFILSCTYINNKWYVRKA